MKRLVGSWLALVLLLAACSTTPKVDWESRVGSFTFDEAVLEMGPPDKAAQLTDGTRVVEWMTHRGRDMGGSFYSMRGPWIQRIPDAPAPDQFLRLTFDPAGKLRAWKKHAR